MPRSPKTSDTTDRSALIRLASSLPRGSKEKRELLSTLKKGFSTRGWEKSTRQSLKGPVESYRLAHTVGAEYFSIQLTEHQGDTLAGWVVTTEGDENRSEIIAEGQERSSGWPHPSAGIQAVQKVLLDYQKKLQGKTDDVGELRKVLMQSTFKD